MKALAAAFWVSAIGMLFPLGGYGQATAEGQFQVEIQATGEKGPTYTVTNLSGKTVWACVIELSFARQNAGKSRDVWDAVLQEVPPIEPDAKLSQSLSHIVGGPLPDKVEVIAGVWADGETFGQPAWVNIILQTRAMRAMEFEQASAILQKGLELNWTSAQYLEMLGDKTDSGPFISIRSALAANQRNGERPKILRNMMQRLLDTFVQRANRIRLAKPAASTPIPD
jgi:hypothetical protein